MGKGSWFSLARVFLKNLPRLPLSCAPYFTDKFRHTNPHRHKGRLYLNLFFPAMPSPAFNRFLDIVANNRRVPMSTYFAVTQHCPFKCPHCSYGSHQPGQMTTEEAIDAVRQIRDLGSTIIGFTGGEPLLRKDLAELVREIGDDTLSVVFTTGSGLTPERAAELVESGLECMMLGVESPDKEEHDRIRGREGSFDEAMAAVQIALDAGLYTGIATVGTREKLVSGKLQQLAELGTELGVHEFRITEPVPTGSFRGRTDEVLTPEEQARLADFQVQWNLKRKGPAVACFAYLESDEMMGCGAGYHHLFVDALGNVCPCDLTPLSLGNLRQEPLSEIWDRMGEWFDQPRRGCFAKFVAEKLAQEEGQLQFPLEPDLSETMCNACRRQGDLPGIYQRLKGKPASTV